MIYDFDGTLAPGNMQEYDFIPAVGKSNKEFWTEANTLAEEQDADMVLYKQIAKQSFSFISPYTIPPEKSFKSFSPLANPLQEGVPAEGSHREKVSGRGRILQLHQPVHIAILGMDTLYP